MGDDVLKFKRLSVGIAMFAGTLVPLIAPASPAEAAPPTEPVAACPSSGAIIWDGASGANFDVNTNWVGDVLPGPTDTVCLPTGSLVSSYNDFTVGTILAEAGTAIFVEDGTLTTTDANLSAVVMRTSGELAITGEATIWRELTIQDGGLVGGGDVVVDEVDGVGAYIDISSAHTHTVHVNLTSYVVATWSAGDVDNAGYTWTQASNRIDGSVSSTKQWTTDRLIVSARSSSLYGEVYPGPNTTIVGDVEISAGQARFYSYGSTIDGNVIQTDGRFGVEAGDDLFSRNAVRETTITGNYTHSGGSLALGVIDASTHDTLTVGGTYAMSGPSGFQLVGDDDYNGAIGDEFEMITATSVTGFYAVVSYDTLVETEASPVYNPANVTFEIVEARASVGGEVYYDLDGNGVVNDDEYDEPVENAAVFADANSNGILDSGEASDVTGPNGDYFFRMPAGTYDILVVEPEGYEYKGAGYMDRVFTSSDSLNAEFGLAVKQDTSQSPPAKGTGYWLIGQDGGIYAYGESGNLGSPKTLASLNAPIASLAPKATGGGYWAVGRDGGVFAYGTAGFYGSMGGKPLNSPVRNIASTPSGNGYWLVGEDGGVFAFGDAKFNGSAAGINGKSRIVGMVPTPTGNGYWLAAADGGVFAYGDAAFMGSMGGKPLNAPVVGIAADASGSGYYLVAADGGVFAYGSARFHGSANSTKLNSPIVSMKSKADGSGYALIAADGGVFAYGSDKFLGAPTGTISAPVVQ
jgi:hypothetical protein